MVVTVVTTLLVLSAVGWYFLRMPDEPVGAEGATISAPADDAAAERALRKKARELARPAKISGKPGLTGEGFSRGVKGLDLRITVTSSAPIGTIGYLIPTSQDKATGTVSAGTSWSLRTQVFGPGDHAQVFFQAGPSGAPITCVITVEGKVTERRSTVGPYGQTMCQG